VSFATAKSKAKIKTQIPKIEIKVGVHNNHYNFFNTIDESAEDDDDKMLTVIGIQNSKIKICVNKFIEYKFKQSSKEYKLVSPKTIK